MCVCVCLNIYIIYVTNYAPKSILTAYGSLLCSILFMILETIKSSCNANQHPARYVRRFDGCLNFSLVRLFCRWAILWMRYVVSTSLQTLSIQNIHFSLVCLFTFLPIECTRCVQHINTILKYNNKFYLRIKLKI